MTRPVKKKIISGSPEIRDFHPGSFQHAESVHITYEEFETIKQHDYKGRTQEDCAQAMGVTRTTVANIYRMAAQRSPTALSTAASSSLTGGKLCTESGR